MSQEMLKIFIISRVIQNLKKLWIFAFFSLNLFEQFEFQSLNLIRFNLNVDLIRYKTLKIMFNPK